MNLPFELKYRPTDFSEIIGNKEIIDGLPNLIKEKAKRTILLSGPRGCGKTTIARIIGKSVGIKSESDFHELNIADIGLKDAAREIIQKTRFNTLSGGPQIWLLDEIQESSSGFQQALLKTLEEPPKNIYFILCTTNPEKLLKTVKSRCSIWNVKLLDFSEAKELIMKVCKVEKIKLNSEIIRQIHDKTEGCPREILVLLEMLKNSENKESVLENYQIGGDSPEIIELCRMLSKKDSWKNLASFLKNFKTEPEQARRAILGYFSAILLNSGNARSRDMIELFEENYFSSGRAGLIKSCFDSTLI